MNIFDGVIITDIEKPITVFSEKGRVFEMKNRSSYGLSICTKGQITYTMNGQEFISNENNAILIPKNASYSLVGDRKGFFPLINFQCENLKCDTFKVFPLNNPKEYIADYQKISEYFLFKDRRLKTFSHFYNMLDRIGNEQYKKQSIILPAINYMKENIKNPKLSNDLLAKETGISEVYFRKLFYKEYNTTPKQYILDIRIQKAKQLLINGKYKINTISEECGFSSVYHFCRIFKEKIGLTPSEYSKQNKIYRI